MNLSVVVPIVALLFSALLVACGPKPSESAFPKSEFPSATPDAGNPNFVAPPPGQPTGTSEKENSIEFAERAWSLIQAAQNSPAQMGEVAVSLVITATALAGSNTMVTTGTLTAPRTPEGEWTYSPSPDDALVYVTSDLEERSFKFLRVFGDLSSVERFVSRAHDLEFTLTEENAELSLHSQRAFGRLERALWGASIINGLYCTLDVSELESSLSTTDSREHSEKRQSGWSGWLTCDDEAFAFTESLDVGPGSSEREFSYYLETGRHRVPTAPRDDRRVPRCPRGGRTRRVRGLPARIREDRRDHRRNRDQHQR